MVVNLTDLTLDNNFLSLLSKGLSFCLPVKFYFVDFVVKAKLYLHKYFRKTGSTTRSRKEGEIPSAIGPLGFSATNLSDVTESECIMSLLCLCG